MTDEATLAAVPLGPITAARLYIGEHDLEIHSFEHPLGSLACAVIACEGKPGGCEDSAAIVPVSDDCLALMVADGVGGAATPRKASNTVVEVLRDTLTGTDHDDARIRTAILDGIEHANQVLLQMGTGTATTLVVVDIQDNHLRTFHVGDSSAWLVGQRGAIKYQTTPHSPVGFAVEAGLLDEHEALGHEDLHVITNVIGSNDMRIEIGPRTQVAARDTLLLASDGLFDNVLQDEIIELIRTGPVHESIANLAALSLERMAGKHEGKPSKPDDFSAILFRPGS